MIENIQELAAALVKAQGQFPGVVRTGRNPHLKSEYATLDDIIASVRSPLAENGLCILQPLESGEGKITIRTVLLHQSGQSIESVVEVSTPGTSAGRNAIQELGAAITYMKRYSLAAMLGIAADTDGDGEGALPGAPPGAPKREKAAKAAPQAPTSGEEGQRTISSPKALYDAVNSQVMYYNSIPHMLNTIRKLRNDQRFNWPPPMAVEEYEQLFGELVDYATVATAPKKTQAEPEDDEDVGELPF